MIKYQPSSIPNPTVLSLPVTWHNAVQAQIPLSYVLERTWKHIYFFALGITPGYILLTILTSATFKPFMHIVKPLEHDPAPRAIAYMAVCVVSLWLLSFLKLKKNYHRYLFLIHSSIPLYFCLQTVFANG